MTNFISWLFQDFCRSGVIGMEEVILVGLLTVSLGRDIDTYHSCSYVYFILFCNLSIKINSI